MSLFETIVVVDWSARSRPSPARPSKDAIWWCAARGGVADAPVYCRTRAAAEAALTALVREERAAGRRVLLGFDFPFGYPAGVAARLTGQGQALALWSWLEARVQDAPDNRNNRFAVAEEINAAWDGLGPAWGRPANWPHPGVPTRAKVRHGAHPAERRLADAYAKGAKTVWQLAYAGSVGSQVLLGLPVVSRLRRGLPALVWPFDTGLCAPDAPVVLAEVYPSLLQAEAHGAGMTPLDAAQVMVNARAFSRLDAAGRLTLLFSPEVSTSEQVTIEAEEAWILGLGHEDALRRAA